jgi:hypothetical protein
MLCFTHCFLFRPSSPLSLPPSLLPPSTELVECQSPSPWQAQQQLGLHLGRGYGFPHASLLRMAGATAVVPVEGTRTPGQSGGAVELAVKVARPGRRPTEALRGPLG